MIGVLMERIGSFRNSSMFVRPSPSPPRSRSASGSRLVADGGVVWASSKVSGSPSKSVSAAGSVAGRVARPNRTYGKGSRKVSFLERS